FPEKQTFLRQRVEARLASLLMESKEYSEALSVLSGLYTESTVRVVHRLPLVFFVVSELKQQTPRESFHCTQKVSFHFSLFSLRFLLFFWTKSFYFFPSLIKFTDNEGKFQTLKTTTSTK
ncbi:unnamed protein product, partial [Prunus brigantina]